MTARPCCKRGCTGIIRDDICSRCGQVKKHGWTAYEKQSASSRGYDAAWQKVRAAFIAQKTLEVAMDGISAYPICEMCGKPIYRKKDIHVDHIKPFHGRDDPLRLDMDNLRLMHERCHMAHHGREKHK